MGRPATMRPVQRTAEEAGNGPPGDDAARAADR